MITALVYDDTSIEQYDDLQTARDEAGTTWVHAGDATEAEITRITDAFNVHPLTVEDLRNNVRAKTEAFPEYTFVLLKTVSLAAKPRSPRKS